MATIRLIAKSITTKDTIPASTATTGTITIAGNEYTTTASDQLSEGDFLYVAANSETIRVSKVKTSTTGVLERNPAGTVSGSAFKKVLASDMAGVELISFIAIGGTNEVLGEEFTEDLSIPVQLKRINPDDVIEPPVVDPDGNTTKYILVKRV